MPSAKIAITIDRQLLAEIDGWVIAKRFPNRSRAIQEALREQIARAKRIRFERECDKADPIENKRMAEEGMEADSASWPEY